MWELDLGDGGEALWAPVAVYTRKPREALLLSRVQAVP